MKAKLLLVHALSPLHAGTGQGAGILDLPIAREKSTLFPYLPGSSLKGVLRDACVQKEEQEPKTKGRALRLFGPETANASDYAGALVFTDQRLLLFPVRSLQGTFAWVTCPLVLERFRRDCRELEDSVDSTQAPSAVPPLCSMGHAAVCSGSVLVHEQRIYLEDLDLSVQRETLVEQWAAWLGPRLFPELIHTHESPSETPKDGKMASSTPKGKAPQKPQAHVPDAQARLWQDQLKGRLCLVHDDVFSFLVETATEVNARIRLQPDTKTVTPGGLWYEENLPSESVLSGFVAFMPNQKSERDPQVAWNTLHRLTQEPLQLGGKATVGRGLCSLRFQHSGGSHADS